MFPSDICPPYYSKLFDGRDVEVLVNAILQAFDERTMRRMLYYGFTVDWDNKVAPGAFEDRVFGLAVALQSAGQLHWLIRHLDRVRPRHDVFIALRDKATPPLPAFGSEAPGAGPGTTGSSGVDPWRRVLLHTDRPFLDRETFREDCRRVGLGNTKPILSVAGGRDTGKSYSADYLRGVTKALRQERVIVVKELLLDRLNGVVEVGASADIGGKRLAQRLSEAITEKPLADYIDSTFGSEDDPPWAADAVNWMMANAAVEPLRWLVFDGFDTTVLSHTAQALIDSLLAAVARDPKIRIALLGYRGNLSFCAAAVREVRLDLDEFVDRKKLTNHILAYLVEVREAAVARARPRFTDDELLEQAHNVLARVNPAAPDLTDLESALTGVAERFLVGP